MAFSITVVYPNEDDATFDLDYYMSTHMPLVSEQWGPYGLKSWEIVKFGLGLDGSKPIYSIEAILSWESEESVKSATTSDAAKIVLGDIPNFSNKSPIILQGKVVGNSKTM